MNNNSTRGDLDETVKDEIKKQEGGAQSFLRALLAPLAASLVQSVISSVEKGIHGGVQRAARGYMIKIFSSAPSFK